jgi:hypothetical protein
MSQGERPISRKELDVVVDAVERLQKETAELREMVLVVSQDFAERLEMLEKIAKSESSYPKDLLGELERRSNENSSHNAIQTITPESVIRMQELGRSTDASCGIACSDGGRESGRPSYFTQQVGGWTASWDRLDCSAGR